MEITITTKIKSVERWYNKSYGLILVTRPEYIDVVHKYLTKRDDYRGGYDHLIKVMPDVITSGDDLDRLCDYCHKTGIDDVPGFIADMKAVGIDVFVWQVAVM